MRMLFFGAAAAGHLFPMLPLMTAARNAGDVVCVATGAGGSALLPGWDVVEHGPTMLELIELTGQRMRGDDGTTPGAGSGELFGGMRIELAADAGVLRAARDYRPDVVVTEMLDEVGTYIAAALRVPLVIHALTGPIPPDVLAAVRVRADRFLEIHELTRPTRSALVDPFPDVLVPEALRNSESDRLAIKPAVYDEGPRAAELPERTPGRARVLVSLGTVVSDLPALRLLVAGVVAADADAIVTLPPGMVPDEPERDHVTWVGFAPLAGLLPEVDAVVTAGGTGTVLAALSAGLPMAVRPFLADQPWNAELLKNNGLATVIVDDRESAREISRVLTDPSYASRARAVRAEIDTLPTAAEVLEWLRTHSGGS